MIDNSVFLFQSISNSIIKNEDQNSLVSLIPKKSALVMTSVVAIAITILGHYLV
jgi:hypothetical protein